MGHACQAFIDEVARLARRELVAERLHVLAAQAGKWQVAPDLGGHGDGHFVCAFRRRGEIAGGHATITVRKELGTQCSDRTVRGCSTLQTLCLAHGVPELHRVLIIHFVNVPP